MSTSSASTREAKFERGFKTWSENIAVSLRERMGLTKIDALAPESLAHYMRVRVLEFSDLPLSLKAKTHLSSPEGDEWSAVTIRCGSTDAIIVNPSHSLARRSSNLAHELSHLLRKHKPAQLFISPNAGIQLRTYESLQEDEADWLTGCLLLPRPALLYCLGQRWDDEAICEHYRVSKALLTYRRNVSGVQKQLRTRRH